MSQICNKYLPVDDPKDLLLKDGSIKAASRELCLAASNLALAGAKIEVNVDSVYPMSYLKACVRHLDAAVAHYDTALHVVKNSVPTPEALEWIAAFDFERFFTQKTSSGSIPNRPDLWESIVIPSKKGDVAASTENLRNRLHELSDRLASWLDVGRFAEQPVSCLREAVTKFADAQMLAIIIAELNDVKPLDPTWVDIKPETRINASVSLSEGR